MHPPILWSFANACAAGASWNGYHGGPGRWALKMTPTFTHQDLSLDDVPEKLFHPKVGVLDTRSVLVTDLTGSLRIIDLISRSQHLTASPIDPLISYYHAIYDSSINSAHAQHAILVTRRSRFFVWQVGTEDFTPLFSESGEPVQCVAFSPSGKQFAIGTGDYPLDPSRFPEAHIELWSFEDCKPKFERCVVLPGVCLDAIAWDEDEFELCCVTGMRNQKFGFLVQTDSDAIPRHYWELRAAMYRACVYRTREQVLTLSRAGLACISPQSGRTHWTFPVSEVGSMAYDSDSDEIALSNGVVINARNGTVASEMSPLEHCSSIALISKHNYVGVSDAGVIRCWSA